MINKIGFKETIYQNNNLSKPKANILFQSIEKDSISFTSSKAIKLVGKQFKNKIKIIFADIDGTLSEHSDKMTPKTIASVNFLHHKKVPVILTTARCYKDVLPISNQFAHKPDYMIILQGGAIVDKNGKMLMENKISEKNGRNLIDWHKNLLNEDDGTHLIMYFDDEAYALSDIQYPWQSRSLIKQVKSFDQLFADGLTLQKAILYKPDLNKNLTATEIIRNFENTGFNEIGIKNSGCGCFELQNKNVSKDKAIEIILNRLGLDAKSAMAIGDSSNDIEMLDFIRNGEGLAIAMGNAGENVKLHANAVTAPVNADGFSGAIKQLFNFRTIINQK